MIKEVRLIGLGLIILLSILPSCKKKEVPTLTTTAVTNVTGISATSGGTIIDEGSGTIVEKGVCWNKEITPTISDNMTIEGSGAGTFISNLTNLNATTTYYLRAYATNGAGTGYGNQVCFITLENPPYTAFTTTSTNITLGQSVQFNDQSSNFPTSWSWNFGDGNESTLMNPSHTYLIAGTYTVTLTTSNSFGFDTEIRENLIIVNSSLPFVYLNSVIGNATPSILEMTYNITLANIIPPNTAFTVQVNGINRGISSIAISGNKVLLTLLSPVVFGDFVTVSYTDNQLQSTTGDITATLTSQPVTNNLLDPTIPNGPPVVVIKYIVSAYSGFVYELDASGSYDLNDDLLTFKWTIPANIQVTSTTSSKIRYLAPNVTSSETINFGLTVSDGRVSVSKNITIIILPYKPACGMAKNESRINLIKQLESARLSNNIID